MAIVRKAGTKKKALELALRVIHRVPIKTDDSNDGMEGRKPTQGVKNQKKDDYKTSGSTHGHKKAS